MNSEIVASEEGQGSSPDGPRASAQRPADKARGARPFLKWAGGKSKLLARLEKQLPEGYGRYFEPFVGGGALFFHHRPSGAVLADVNERLVRTYRVVRDDVEALILCLQAHQERHDKAYFYALRDQAIDAAPDVEVAAWMIYLNKTAFNGLYRVNRKNQHNVPIGSYTKPTICDPVNLRACSEVLQGVVIVTEDFRAVCDRAVKGDFVYFDPPYVPVSKSSNFTSYAQGGFGPQEQAGLRDLALKLKKRGVKVLLSNSWCDEVLALYSKGFEVQKVSAPRAINSAAEKRGKVFEALIT